MPVPIKRKTGYALAYGSLAVAGVLVELYLRSAWMRPLPAVLYGALGLALAASVLCALILAADGVRLMLSQPRARWVRDLVLDFVPLALVLLFWML